MKDSKSFQFIKKLNTMMCARITTWVTTHEEERFFNLFKKIALLHRDSGQNEDKSFKVYAWSATEGLVDLENMYFNPPGMPPKKPKQVMAKINDPAAIASNFGKDGGDEAPVLTFTDTCSFISQHCKNRVFIIKDIHGFIDSSREGAIVTIRRIRDLIFHVRTNNGYLIFISPQAEIPTDLESDIQLLDMPLPDEIDITNLINLGLETIHQGNPDIKFGIEYKTEEGRIIKSDNENAQDLKQKLIFNLRGLTEPEISQIIAYVCVKHKGINNDVLHDIKDSKKQIIEKTSCLQFIPTAKETQVGGHEVFKKYINQRGLYLQKEFRDRYSLKPPKGILSVGIPGCGKSILAKYIAGQWNVPLIRMSVDAIFGKYLGESEGRMREAIKIAEANAPCVLWIDEIEKAFGGVGSTNDSGTSSRIFGKLLTWMAEREEMVYMYATANQIHQLPPEFLRAGRFDNKFWADLPSAKECKEIIEIHSKINNFELDFLDYLSLSNYAFDNNLTGAEIEQAILDAVYQTAEMSFDQQKLIKVSSDTIKECMKNINAHAKTHELQINADRKKALNDFVFTSEETKLHVKKLVAV